MTESDITAMSEWIKKEVEKAGAAGAVFGISGGIDSAVTAALCKKAAGDNSLGLIMPCHSLEEDLRHAELVSSTIGVSTQRIDLAPAFDGLKALLPPGNQIACANLKPRLRMITLYYFSNLHNYLVVGTGNKSEISLGYFTKYGDGGVDILPLGDLLKDEVREIARLLRIPREIIEKAPSAGLWAGQTDESEMGVTYNAIDKYLSDKKEEVSPEKRERISAMIAKSVHKRDPLPVYRKISH
ncbi:MAG: NAD(+) synthase [Pseudomonadota bacterium]